MYGLLLSVEIIYKEILFCKYCSNVSKICTGTFKLPRPIPISICGLLVPWKSEPPVINNPYRFAKVRSIFSSQTVLAE